MNNRIDKDLVKAEESEVLFSYKHNDKVNSHPILTVKLNRPKSLNALNLDMLTQLYQLWHSLELEEKDKSVSWFSLSSDHLKGFCAGGDVKALALQLKNLPGQSAHQASENFFALEYAVDELGYKLSQKITSYFFGHGIIYGGGLGLIQGLKFRLVDLSAKFSMPETKIGLFPDVGSSHFMAKSVRWRELFLFSLASWEFGPRLALEAKLIDGVFKNKFKYASQKEEDLDQFILECEEQSLFDKDHFHKLLTNSLYSSAEEIPWTETEEMIGELCQQKFFLDWLGEIEKSFQEDWRHLSVSEFVIDSIVEKLIKLFQLAKEHQFVSWSADCIKRCPSSLAVTVLLFLKGKELTLHENFMWEQGLAQFMCLRPDFFEGVRALLIDKDLSPRWHKSLS